MEQATISEPTVADDSNVSGVTWGAVIGGAFGAAALSLALTALGTGIGLSAVSPWANSGGSTPAIGWTAILWLILVQVVAASMGGYLAGRLRVKWVGVHTHEVYFRDTAHGFLAWAVGVVIMAAFLASAATLLVGSARGSAPGADASGEPRSMSVFNPGAYYVDLLLRTSPASSARAEASLRGETARIFAHGLAEGNLPQPDRSYLSQVVAAKVGINEPEAEKRVDDVFARAQQAAEHGRKVVAHSMYWTFLALLMGAFCASVAATIGGKQRDRVVVI